MEDIHGIRFRARAEDISLWDSIFSGLQNGETGAIFQDKMSIFGEEVDVLLGRLIDEEEGFGPDAFELAGWRREGNVFHLEFEFPDIEFSEALRELFALCPVEGLEVETDWE